MRRIGIAQVGGEKGDLTEGFPSRVCGFPGCMWLFGVV